MRKRLGKSLCKTVNPHERYNIWGWSEGWYWGTVFERGMLSSELTKKFSEFWSYIKNGGESLSWYKIIKQHLQIRR